ncbi:hypothetical protein AX15_002531 [Amanita polypyramis BW_CC]|nr:hypothetical protein AX15_002531 [Amanita polypyramis BW_CC]
MSGASSGRIFKPLLGNPLHDIPSERQFIEPFPSTSSFSPPRPIPAHKQLPAHGTSVQDPMPPAPSVNDSPIPQGTTAPSFLFPPISSTIPNVQVLPAFLFVANHEGQNMTWTAPLFPQAGTNLEDVTRANLIPLMISKGFITPPPGWTIPLSQSPHSHDMPYTTGIHIQPSSLGSSSVVINESEEEGVTTAHEPVTSTDDDYESEPLTFGPPVHISKPYSHTSRKQKSHHASVTSKSRAIAQAQQRRKRILTQSTKNDLGKHKKPISKVEFINWATALDSLWYLLEQDKYTQNEHERLVSLLRSIDSDKNRPVDLKLLKETKVVEGLKKLKKEESLFRFDPWVRHTASSIIRFWKAQFEST